MYYKKLFKFSLFFLSCILFIVMIISAYTTTEVKEEQNSGTLAPISEQNKSVNKMVTIGVNTNETLKTQEILVEPQTVISLDGKYKVIYDGYFLDVYNKEGEQLGKLLVKSQQAYLVDFNVTNKGIYMVFNQRGNTDISFADFNNVSQIVSVKLPKGITPASPESVKLIKGTSLAYITSTDRKTYLVDLEIGKNQSEVLNNMSKTIADSLAKNIELDMRYDVNNDGKVSITDSLLLSRYAAGLSVSNEVSTKIQGLLEENKILYKIAQNISESLATNKEIDIRYDVNSDGKVSITDSLLISRYADGLSVSKDISTRILSLLKM